MQKTLGLGVLHDDDTQHYPILRLQSMAEKFRQSLNEPNNQISMNVPKV